MLLPKMLRSRPATSCSLSRALSQCPSLNGAEEPCRSTLSKIWVPTGKINATEGATGHQKLIRAGFLRQAHSGIYQYLPLGLRVQHKMEALLDKHMQSIGASRLSLSTFTTEDLWRKSGRLEHIKSELFRLTDRKQTPLMLSSTHEEEITTLVSECLKSYRDLPLRLYQTTRKYRDEMRPRHGLLRTREFIMKDLYTFDLTLEAAMETYREVSAAYRAFFADLKLPVLVVEASSGNMGGDHSHEYHLANAVGEDTVVTCGSCGFAASDDVAATRQPPRDDEALGRKATLAEFLVWRGVTKDGRTLVNAWYPRYDKASTERLVNIHAVREVVPELDASLENPLKFLSAGLRDEAGATPATLQVINVVDARLASAFEELRGTLPVVPAELANVSTSQSSVMEAPTGRGLNLVRLVDGDGCPRCETGSLQVQRAMELGHTFCLGTRYSQPLGLSVTLPSAPGSAVPVQMGCYGIGTSRLLGAVAEHKADQQGLNWPRAIAPFEVVLIPSSDMTDDMVSLYDRLAGHKASSPRPGFDVVLDDREATFGWKIQDADIIGYPIIVVLGRAWKDGRVEVQCRSLAVKEEVAVGGLSAYIESLLSRL